MVKNRQRSEKKITIDAPFKKGEVIIYPTETAYAFGADSRDAMAVKKIFKIKGRVAVKTLPLIAGSLTQAEKFVNFSKLAKKIAKHFWPGPLTIILPIKNKNIFAKQIIAKDNTVALRVSASKFARELALKVGAPIVSTSVNKSGEPTCFTIKEIMSQWGGALPVEKYFQEENKKKFSKNKKVSTIIKIENEKIILLRAGAVPFKKVKSYVNGKN